MAESRDRSIARLTGLILAPVVLLAVIAIFGLVQYRHAVTEDARREAAQWASEKQAALARAALIDEASSGPALVLFTEIPGMGDRESADAERLAEATGRGDAEALRALTHSPASTAAGLPVRVLAAWRVFDLTGEVADARRLANLAIHEAPSAISAPIVETLCERIGEEENWEEDWRLSEDRRRVLAAHVGATGLVNTADGPALIEGNRVLTPGEVRAFLEEWRESAALPAWMELDYVAAGTSVIAPISRPLVRVGADLELVAGISDEKLLYARYWRIVWWVAALITCALATAVVGIWVLQRTLARERRLNELKSQFVASVSHELRAPVASMRLMADALDAGKVRGKEAGEFHRLMSQEAARLSSMIENVLDFARIEEGRKDYSFQETDLPALVKDTVQLMEPVAKERGIAIEVRSDAPGSAPHLDPNAIQQVLVNLLDNAIKFSPDGGTVQVTLGNGPDAWTLAVSDRGPGVPVADRERVFERFARLGNELRRETRGAGIGLSIVQHAADAHAGTVRIGEAEGGGAEFVVECANRGDPGGAEEATIAREHPAGAPGVTPKRATP